MQNRTCSECRFFKEFDDGISARSVENGEGHISTGACSRWDMFVKGNEESCHIFKE